MTEKERARFRAIGWRWAAMAIVLVAFFVTFFNLLAPFSPRQFNAAFSLMWMAIYMVGGIWAGWRLFAIGAVAAIGIVYGYYRIEEHFALWMGLVGGGALILGGLWLRKV